MKVTKAQAAALAKLPVTVTYWGGRPWAGMPPGVRQPTLDALVAKGIVRTVVDGQAWPVRVRYCVVPGACPMSLDLS